MTRKTIPQKILSGSFLMCIFALCGCVEDDPTCCPPPERPNTWLFGNEIVIADVADIPPDVTFDKVQVNICGACWKTIETIEGAWEDGRVVLALPEDFPEENLQEAIRVKDTICGHWVASSDVPDAHVAGLRDLIAYNGEQRVGRFYLTDWPRTGSIVGKSWVYYHYADRPFSLSGTHGTYRYTVSFGRGWNAYINTNLTESTGKGTVLCTTSISSETDFVWRFESWVY